MLKFFSILLLVPFGMGCSSNGAVHPDSGYVSVTPIESLDTKQVGDSVPLNGVQYSVAKEYFAASGKPCKLLQSAQDGDVRAACQSGQSRRWYVRDALGTNTSQNPQPSVDDLASTQLELYPTIIAESTSIVVADEATADLPAIISSTPLKVNQPFPAEIDYTESRKLVVVRPGETLWKFSRRVTGNALDWQRIAEHNNISDVTAIKAGDSLSIPEELDLLDEGG